MNKQLKARKAADPIVNPTWKHVEKSIPSLDNYNPNSNQDRQLVNIRAIVAHILTSRFKN